MKRIFFICTLFALATQANAQSRNDYIGISFGSANPLGGFAATNNSYDKAGFATGGASFNINYMHRFDDLFSLAISSFGASNGISTSKFMAVTGADAMTVNKTSSASCLLIGGVIKTRDFPLYGKIQIGFGTVQTADLTIYDNSGDVGYYQQSDPAFGFAYDIGVGGMLPLSSRWALTASVDYIGCTGKPSIVYSDNINGPYTTGAFSYGQSFICAQVGIGYMFGPRMGGRRAKPRPIQRY